MKADNKPSKRLSAYKPTSHKPKMTEEDYCYICFEAETDEMPFLKHRMCACKGTIKIHQLCCELMRPASNHCPICKDYMYERSAFDSNVWRISYPNVTMKKNGVLHGPSYDIRRRKDGTHYCAGRSTYVNGKREGPVTEYDEAGNVVTKGTYENDKLNGSYSKYWPDGQQYYFATYADGLLDGEVKHILNVEPEPITYIATYSKGRPIEGTVIERDGEWSATLREPVYIVIDYSNGNRHGKYMVGTLAELLVVGQYNNGLKEGTWTHYNPTDWVTRHGSSELKYVINYKDGELHGLVQAYCRSGIYFSGNYVAGEPIGRHRYNGDYDASAKQYCVYYDRKGRIHGVAHYYDKYGKLEQRLTCRRGRLHGLQTLYMEGKRIVSFHMDKNVLQGRYTIYKEDGTTIKGQVKKEVPKDLADCLGCVKPREPLREHEWPRFMSSYNQALLCRPFTFNACRPNKEDFSYYDHPYSDGEYSVGSRDYDEEVALQRDIIAADRW